MSNPESGLLAADRNLLFGVLALQADLLNAQHFAEACSAWASRKGPPLADLLVERGWLTGEECADVNKLLARKLAKHDGDVRASLVEALSDPVREALSRVIDPAVQQTLDAIPPPNGGHGQTTVNYHPVGRERYTLNRLHARGGIGQVWLARDSDLGREVALKELLPDRDEHPAVVARFLAEAKITGQLEHPNIVPVYELARPADRGEGPFYTTRFVRGRTLSEAIRDYHRKRQAKEAGPLELRELLGHFVAVCNAVAYAHSRGVLHRDLKPGNVVLGDFGEVIVLDWGLAKVKGSADLETNRLPVVVTKESPNEKTVQGQAIGTPSYMPPEQAEGRLDLVDERSDVYGLGAVLYEILSGQPPFEGPDTPGILTRVIAEVPEPPQLKVGKTSPALVAVCLRALAKRPASRYASAKELAQDVQRWLGDEPVSAYREPLMDRLRRHRTAVAVAAAVALVLIVSFAGSTALLTAANARERSAREEAVGERDEAERQRARADRNLVSARSVVEQYCTNIAEDRRLKQQDLQVLRRKLLETAVPFYTALVAQNASDSELLADQGRAYYRLARLLNEMGQTNDAQADYERAIEIFERRAKECPDDPEAQVDLAGAYRYQGELLGALGRRDEGQVVLQKAIALLEPLATRQHPVPQAADWLSAARRSLGNAFQVIGRWDEARASLKQSVDILEALVVREPGNINREEDLGGTHLSLGVTLRGLGRKEEALAEWQRATDILARLVAREPAEAHVRSTLSRSAE